MAFDAYLADPTRRWFEIGGAYDVDLPVAVQSFEAVAREPLNWLSVRNSTVRAPIKRR